MARFLSSSMLIILILSIISIYQTSASQNNQKTDVLFEKVDRIIDLSSQLTKTTIKIDIKNPGKSTINNFIFTLDDKKSKNENLSDIKAFISGLKKTKLDIIKTTNNSYQINLKKPLLSGGLIKVEIETVSSHEMIPFPKEITQREKQYVKFTENIYLYTPYVVNKQTLKLIMSSKTIKSYTKIKNNNLKDSTLTYEIVDKTNGFNKEDITVHFENNNKFLTVTKLERLIEISHWGNIAIEETIDLLHTGALLKGSFSRYEYSMQHSSSGHSSVQNFDTILPASASDIYYRDDIGNISTSNIRIKRNSIDVNLRPRFPLFGGWKTKYTIGYNVPSYEYLYHDGDKFILNMRLIDHIFDNMVIDEAVVKIILPEGSKNIELSTPYDVVRLPDTLHYSYLDTTGRPVVTLTKKNLVENHIMNFKLKYNFSRFIMFQEPLLVVVAFYLLFLLVIIYVRLDFSIDKKEEDIDDDKKTIGKKNQ